MMEAAQQHHLLHWQSMEHKGVMHRQAEALGTPLKRAHGVWYSRWVERFITRCVADVQPMPVNLRQLKSEHASENAVCPLCGTEEAGLEHVIRCRHAEMVSADPLFDEEMVDIVALPARAPDVHAYPACFYSKPYSYKRHPALDVPYAQLYPYDTDTPERELRCDSPLDVVRLPESEWYRHSSSRRGVISVRDPRNPSAPPLKVVESEFWRLIAMHDYTHSTSPLSEGEYEQRAGDLYAVLQMIPHTKAADDKSWACPMELLRIIVDEAACTAELFSHLLNSSYLLSDHYSDLTAALGHGRFARAAMQHDGLGEGAFLTARSVVANPPYVKGMVRKLKEQVCRRARLASDFRAVLIIPMDSEEEALWDASANCEVIASFPPGALPFVPAAYWRGDRPYKPAKGYDEVGSRVVIALCDSDVGGLAPLDLMSFRKRLAAWYVGAVPFACLRAAALESTRLEPHISCLLNGAVYDSFPSDWKFWDSLGERSSPEGAYHGGLSDSYSVNGTPCRNVVVHEPLVAMLGSLPDLFDKFLLLQGHAPGECKAVISRVRLRLFAHFQRRWLAYQRLVRSCAPPRPGTALVPADPVGSTQGVLPPGGWVGGRCRTVRIRGGDSLTSAGESVAVGECVASE